MLLFYSSENEEVGADFLFLEAKKGRKRPFVENFYGECDMIKP